MQIKHEHPPNFAAILAVFPRAKAKAVVFTYGDILYVPHGIELPQAILAHEVVHSLQQGKYPEAWWGRYLRDKRFRLEQELEAHRAEYLAYRTLNRATRQMHLDIIAGKLSSALYKHMVKKSVAKLLISGKIELKPILNEVITLK